MKMKTASYSNHLIGAVTASVFLLCVNIAPAAEHRASGKAGESAESMDATFIKKAADGGLTEVRLGEIATKNAQAQDVKEFGHRMVSDHSKANNELKGIAKKLGVEVPGEPSAKHKETIAKLSKLTGPEFDKAYARDMVEDHMEDVGEFEKASKSVKDQELKGFIDRTLPTLREHLKMAKAMSKGGGEHQAGSH